MSKVWELIKAGSFENACIRADAEWQESKSVLSLRNKVFALLNLGRLEEAGELCRDIIRCRHGDTDTDFIFLGVSQWLLGHFDSAVATWRDGAATKFTDAAGGVEVPLLLFFASVKTSQDSLRIQSLDELRKLCKSSASANWPGPIAGYVLGDLSEEKLESSMSQHPLLRAKQACQSAFYIGVRRLLEQDEAGFRQAMVACTNHGPVTMQKQEYYLGKAESNWEDLLERN